MGTISVSPAMLHAVARRIETAADLVAAAATVRLQFDGAVAGRSHSAAGGAVRNAMELLIADARQWAADAHGTAAALRTSADCWLAADEDAAAALR